MVNYIIFDFDGTLADTYALGIRLYNQICSSYKGLPITEEEGKQLRDYALPEIFRKRNVNLLQLPFMIAHLKQLLNHHIKQIELVSGIPQVLAQLKAQGYKLGIVSSNSRQNIQHALQNWQMEGLFEFIHVGNNIFGKHRVLRRMLIKQNINPDTTIYIGDEVRDIQAAKAAGITMIAVSWGYNSRKVLADHHPAALIDLPSDLLTMVFSQKT